MPFRKQCAVKDKNKIPKIPEMSHPFSLPEAITAIMLPPEAQKTQSAIFAGRLSKKTIAPGFADAYVPLPFFLRTVSMVFLCLFVKTLFRRISIK